MKDRRSILDRRLACCVLLGLGLTTARVSADSLIGQVVNASGVGLVGITLKFSGNLPNAVTGVNGLFAVTVPPGSIDVAFEPSTAYAPRLFEGVSVSGTTNMGMIRLEFGFPVSGKVVDNVGTPLAGANIDVYDSVTGVKYYTPGDGTDLLGDFLVTVPVGTCRVRAKPPAANILVSIERRGVVVNAPVVLGQMVLPPGVLLIGTVVDAATQLPVSGVDLDVIEAMTGNEVVTPGDDTAANGAFQVIAPPGMLHVRFDPPAGNSLLAREMLNFYAPGPRNLGAVTLARGEVVRGRVVDGANNPVANADLDVEISPGAQVVYLSHDKSDVAGNFEIVVPNGTYRFVVEPPAATGLVGNRTAATTVSGPLQLPDFVLPAGSRVSGVIRGHDGSPEADVDLDFVDPVSGAEVVTPGDHTDSAGVYGAAVPNGTWNVVFRARRGSFSRTETLTGVLIAGNTTLDRTLSRVPAFVRTHGYGIPTVAQGGPVPMVVEIANPNPTPTLTRLSLWFEDPTGARLPLLTNLDLPLPAGATFASFLWMPLPPVNPILLGRRFSLRVQFDDPQTGLEHDRDDVGFVIQ